MVRGGRAQDCPGVRYKLIRGALDLVSLGLSVDELWADGFTSGRCACPTNESVEVRNKEDEGSGLEAWRWLAFNGVLSCQGQGVFVSAELVKTRIYCP